MKAAVSKAHLGLAAECRSDVQRRCPKKNWHMLSSESYSTQARANVTGVTSSPKSLESAVKLRTFVGALT